MNRKGGFFIPVLIFIVFTLSNLILLLLKIVMAKAISTVYYNKVLKHVYVQKSLYAMVLQLHKKNRINQKYYVAHGWLESDGKRLIYVWVLYKDNRLTIQYAKEYSHKKIITHNYDVIN